MAFIHLFYFICFIQNIYFKLFIYLLLLVSYNYNPDMSNPIYSTLLEELHPIYLQHHINQCLALEKNKLQCGLQKARWDFKNSSPRSGLNVWYPCKIWIISALRSYLKINYRKDEWGWREKSSNYLQSVSEWLSLNREPSQPDDIWFNLTTNLLLLTAATDHCSSRAHPVSCLLQEIHAFKGSRLLH